MPNIMQASKKGMVKSFDLGCEICENYVKSLSGYGSVVQFWSLTLLDLGARGPHGPTLGVISCHSVGDSKFLDFSHLHPYFHLIIVFCCIVAWIKPDISNKFFLLSEDEISWEHFKVFSRFWEAKPQKDLWNCWKL